MKYLLLVAALAAVIGFEACNSSSTPTAPPNYFAGLDKVGSYWVYENREIDTTGELSGASYVDSTWVAGILMKNGKNATMLIKESSDDGSVVSLDTSYISRDGNRLYAFVDAVNNPLLPGNSEPSWVLVAHVDTSATWPAFTPVTIKQDLDFNGTAVIVDIKIEAIISTKGDTAFTAANGKRYTTKNFGLLPKISGKIAPKATPFLSFPLSSSGGEQRQFFADGVGLVGELVQTSVFNIGDGSLVPPQKQPGSLRSLLRYKLK